MVLQNRFFPEAPEMQGLYFRAKFAPEDCDEKKMQSELPETIACINNVETPRKVYFLAIKNSLTRADFCSYCKNYDPSESEPYCFPNDLNGDGKKEFLIMLNSPCGIKGCDPMACSDPVFVFEEKNNNWDLIGKFFSTGEYPEILDSKTDGYKDIMAKLRNWKDWALLDSNWTNWTLPEWDPEKYGLESIIYTTWKYKKETKTYDMAESSQKCSFLGQEVVCLDQCYSGDIPLELPETENNNCGKGDLSSDGKEEFILYQEEEKKFLIYQYWISAGWREIGSLPAESNVLYALKEKSSGYYKIFLPDSKVWQWSLEAKKYEKVE